MINLTKTLCGGIITTLFITLTLLTACEKDEPVLTPARLEVQPTELDFGDNPQQNSLQFTIKNVGQQNLSWTISKSTAWITSFQSTSGTIKGIGENQITVSIDRNKLLDGEQRDGRNQTQIQVTATADDGSQLEGGGKNVTVKAVKAVPPLVEMAASDMVSVLPANLEGRAAGRVTSKGSAPVTEHGHVWAAHKEPTDKDHISRLGEKTDATLKEPFQTRFDQFGTLPPGKYHIRAYATNAVRTVYSSPSIPFDMPAYIRVPAPAQAWVVGTSVSIEWTDNLSENVRIDLMKGGSTEQAIAADASGNNLTYDVPNDLPAGDDYQLKITGTKSGVSGISPTFSIRAQDAPATTEPALTIHTPEVWVQGKEAEITWEAENIPNTDYVQLELVKGSIPVDAGTGQLPGNGRVLNSGTLAYTIPDNLSPADDYQLKITLANDPSVTHLSPAFSLVALGIQTPEAAWLRGTTATIEWTKSDNLSEPVNLDLIKPDGSTMSIAANVSGTNYEYNVPADLPTARSYRLRATGSTRSAVSAQSGRFVVYAPWVKVKANNSNGWSERSIYTSVVHDGKIWVLGGAPRRLNDVWASRDGVRWIQEKANNNTGWSGRWGHTSVVHEGKIYVMGGFDSRSRYRNDVWSSPDGVNWTLEKANNNSGWPRRWGHTSVVHEGKIYVMGGYDGNRRRNDVWSSKDGATWTQVKANNNSGWSGRSSHTSVVHEEKIYVMGGYDGNRRRNDVWSSRDGATWTQVKANDNTGWSGRSLHTSVVHEGKIYVMGGYDGNRRLNDVWSWEPPQ